MNTLVTILQGDCIDVMRTLPDDSIDCVVTSPPYWGLRDYGVAGQMGLESSLAEHLAVMVNVFAEVHRILKPSGTVWVNYGDCYASTPNGRKADDITGDDRRFRDKPFSTIGGVLKPKDLCMMPNRLAIALQEYGWWVRSEIIWGKPNPMPESVTDRPATAHEKIFLLTKSARYWYDAEAVRQNRRSNEDANTFRGGSYTAGTVDKRQVRGNKIVPTVGKQRGHSRRHAGFNERWDTMNREEQQANGRHLKNYEAAPVQVWEIATRPCKFAHFATFPPELAERCILAGCPVGGHVLDPFGGAGTTGLVAAQHNRQATLIELNPEYIDIAQTRLRAGLQRVKTDVIHKPEFNNLPLFQEPSA